MNNNKFNLNNINFEELNRLYEEEHPKEKRMEEYEKLMEDEEKEEKELDELSRQGRKKVDSEKYYDSLCCPECFNCFNLDREKDVCKVGSNYNYMDKYRKECEQWDSIYEPEEGDEK